MWAGYSDEILTDLQSDLCGFVSLEGVMIEFIEIVFEYPHGAYSCPSHTHTWFEMNYIFEGSMYTSFAGNMLEVNAGEFFVIPPGLVHAHQYVADNPHRGICLRWNIKADKVSDKEKAGAKEDVSLTLLQRMSQLLAWNPGTYPDQYGILELFRSLIEESVKGASPLSLKLSALKIILALTELHLPKRREPEPASHTEAALLRKVDIYCNHCYDAKWDVEALAASLHMSYGNLARKYKRLTGKTLVDRMLEIRLEKAKDFLKQSDLSIQDIAEKAGFSSAPYFSRTFTTAFQLSPRAYRSKQKNLNEG